MSTYGTKVDSGVLKFGVISGTTIASPLFQVDTSGNASMNGTLTISGSRSVSSGNAYYYPTDYGDGTVSHTNINLAVAAAYAANGGTVFIPAGTHTITGTISMDFSARSSTLSKAVNLVGAGANATFLNYTGSGTCINFVGGTGGTGGDEMRTYIGHMMIYGGNVSGSKGIVASTASGLYFEHVHVWQMDYGWYMTDILSSVFVSCAARWNDMGMYFNYASFSRPNAIKFISCYVGHSYTYGVLMQGGSSFSWIGGTIENNGINVTATRTNFWGIKVVNAGVEGGTGLQLYGVYFEGNRGTADVWLSDDDTAATWAIAHSITACNFNRIDSTNYTDNNIKLSWARTTYPAILHLGGNCYRAFGTYTENGSRLYIDISGITGTLWDIRGLQNDMQSSTTARLLNGPFGGNGLPLADVKFAGADGTIAAGRNISSVTKNSTGNYSLTFFRTFPSDLRIFVSVQGSAGFGYVSSQSTSSCTVITANTSGTATDFTAVEVLIYGTLTF